MTKTQRKRFDLMRNEYPDRRPAAPRGTSLPLLSFDPGGVRQALPRRACPDARKDTRIERRCQFNDDSGLADGKPGVEGHVHAKMKDLVRPARPVFYFRAESCNNVTTVKKLCSPNMMAMPRLMPINTPYLAPYRKISL